MKHLAIAILCAFSMSACVSDGDDETEETYSNQVKLECNGTVLVDRTFTSKAECESFRDSNTYMCSGITLTISC